LRLDGSYQLSQATNINLEIIVVDEQTFGGDFDNELGKLDSYEVVNATISYAVKQWQLGARINNLLDQEYSETGSLGFGFPSNFESFFPSPERNYWLSAKYLF
jgi:outer membrane receptor protein involved in Fe transport